MHILGAWYMSVPNMKYLCLNLLLGEVFTDDDAHTAGRPTTDKA